MNDYFHSQLRGESSSIAAQITSDIIKMFDGKTIAESRYNQLKSLIEISIEEYSDDYYSGNESETNE